MFKIVEESLAQICLYVAEGLPSEFKMVPFFFFFFFSFYSCEIFLLLAKSFFFFFFSIDGWDMSGRVSKASTRSVVCLSCFCLFFFSSFSFSFSFSISISFLLISPCPPFFFFFFFLFPKKMDNLELGQWSLCIVMLYIVSPYLMKIDKYLKRKKTLKKLGGLPRLTAISSLSLLSLPPLPLLLPLPPLTSPPAVLQKAASSSTFESHHSLSILNPCVERLSQIFTTHSTTLPSPSSSEDLDLFFFSHPPSSPEEDEVETNEDSSESSSTSDTITGPTVSDLETSLGSSLGSYPRSSLESHSAPILSSESKEKGALLGTSVLFLRKKVAKNLQESPGLRMSLEQGAEGFSFGGRKSKRRKEPEIEVFFFFFFFLFSFFFFLFSFFFSFSFVNSF